LYLIQAIYLDSSSGPSAISAVISACSRVGHSRGRHRRSHPARADLGSDLVRSDVGTDGQGHLAGVEPAESYGSPLFRTSISNAHNRGQTCVRRSVETGFPRNMRRYVPRVVWRAGATMLRSKQEQRAVLGEKLFDLANVAAAALVFGQFLGQQSFSWTVIGVGVGNWFALVMLALRLTGAP